MYGENWDSVSPKPIWIIYGLYNPYALAPLLLRINYPAYRDIQVLYILMHIRKIRTVGCNLITNIVKYLPTFSNIVEEIIKSNSIEGRNLYNLDESCVTTVQKVPKVISKKGAK